MIIHDWINQLLYKTIGTIKYIVALQKSPSVVPIPGTTKLAHLEENLRTLDFELRPEEWMDLENTVATIPIIGDRYNKEQQKQVGF